VFSKVDTESLVVVDQLREASDSTVWAIANQRHLIRFTDGAWRGEPTPSSNAIGGIFIDSANTLWLAQDRFLHRRPLAQASYTRTEVPADVVYGFAETPNGDIWLNGYDRTTNANRTQQFDPTGQRFRLLPHTVPFTNGAVVYAADGSLILGSETAGVHRFSPEEAAVGTDHQSGAEPDVFAREHGLSSSATRAVMIDSHGNIWIGGARGLDRLRPARLTRFAPTPEGSRWMLCASRRGELWVSSISGEVYSVSGRARTLLPRVGGNLYSLACADDGHAWFMNAKGVWAVASGMVTPLPPPFAGLDPGQITRVVASSDRTVYVTVSATPDSGGGIWRYKDDHWTRVPGALGVAGLAYVDGQDRLWIGYPGGRITLHTAAEPQEFWFGNPGLQDVSAFRDTTQGLFAGGNGLAVLRDSRFEMLTFAEPSLVRGVHGIVEAQNGDLWLNSANGIAHVPVSELEAGLAQPKYPIRAKLIREGDFASADAPQSVFNYLDTAARDSDGRLWFTTPNGVVHLDPERGVAAVPAPIVKIRSMVADGQPINDKRVLAAATRTLEIQYFGVNLTAPENVVYRYRLEGLDESWWEAGRRTEAIYTRLPPGTYTFSVMASNGDGVWTTPVTSAPLTVPPSFYETRWFAVAMVGLAGLIVGLVHRVRVQQISRVMSARFDERLAERTRVARELHDTLLQTVHGSKLVADRALRDTADHDRLVRALEQLSGWLGQAATEGRATLQALRASTTDSSDLAEAFRRAIDECRSNSSVDTPFSVQGRERVLHSMVRDEVYRIGYEAIRNACRHAQGSRIEVALEYGHDLMLRVSDNGVGIAAAVIESGKEGHFGLRGMRERAERIGAKFTLVSAPGTGTVVTLIVPGRIVFRAV
jgi:signal transduction histidine kinase/ligand-binding sensor domain-containing protein